MSGRNKEELNGVTLLGNQGTKYPMDYAPEMLETFVNKHQDGGISIDPYTNYGRKGTKWEQVAWDRLANHDMYPEKVDNR